MKVLFLDFDGVLNVWPLSKHNRTGSFHKPACINLGYLLQKVPELKIVVSSAWRMWGLDSVRSTLQSNGIDPRRVIDITGNEQDSLGRSYRGLQIDAWLKAHPSVTSFVIFDDESDMDPHMDKLVKTNRYIGLTQANIETALEILEKEK